MIIVRNAIFKEKVSNATINAKNITQKIWRILDSVKNAKYVIQNNIKCITVNNVINAKFRMTINLIVRNVKSVT